MKKGVLGLVIFSIALIFSIYISFSFVSAANIPEQINSAIDGATGILEPLFGILLGSTPSGELLFAKVLFLIIVFSVVWVALSSIELFNRNDWMLFIISAAVSILGVRSISDAGWVQAIILPYTTLAVVISAALPFALYFVLVDVKLKNYKFVRKILWIFFAVVFAGLWFARYDSLQSSGDEKALLIYPITALGALAMAAFDGTISKILTRANVEKALGSSSREVIRDIKREMAKLNKDFRDGIINEDEYRREKKRLTDRLKAIASS